MSRVQAAKERLLQTTLEPLLHALLLGSVLINGDGVEVSVPLLHACVIVYTERGSQRKNEREREGGRERESARERE